MNNAEIILLMSEKPDREVMASFVSALRSSLPNGVISLHQDTNGRTAILMRKNNSLIVALSRYLNETEIARVANALSAELPNLDFDLESPCLTTPVVSNVVEPEVKEKIAMESARAEHNAWVAEKTRNGWKYGTHLSMEAKTHPLMRSWDDLPQRFKTASPDLSSRLLDILSGAGYSVVPTNVLDGMIKIVKKAS
jgi:hypothetical protein